MIYHFYRKYGKKFGNLHGKAGQRLNYWKTGVFT